MTETWLPDLASASGAKYQVIADAIGAAIERRQLRDGDRLPPQRELAARLGVDLTTVTRAYDAARHRGLIDARGRAGSFVIEPRIGAPPEVAPVDTGMNMPPELPDGMLPRAITETVGALMASGNGARLQYQPAGGSLQDRAAGARYIETCGLPSNDEQVIVTAGGQNALHAILGSTLKPGDVVACGRFVYPGFKALAERQGLRLLPLGEMTAEQLDAACARQRVHALYVVPTNDNPTTATLGLDERRAIAEVARRRDLQIIEDDAYAALASEPLRPVAALAPERTWYVASMSKIISPALRVAFVRAPSVSDALRLAADAHETAIMAPPLNSALVTTWLGDGRFGRLVAAVRQEAVSRQRIADRLLGDVGHRRHPEGYHLWLPLPQGMSAHELIAVMRSTGLSVVAGDRFAVEPGSGEAVRVSLGGLTDRDRLASGLRILQGYVASPAGRSAPLI